MRILLVQPDYRPSVGFRRIAMPEPLALEILAATVPDHDVRILDLRFPELHRGTWDEVAGFEPDIVGVTCLTPEFYAVLAVLREAKRRWPRCLTVVGGHHATLCPEDWNDPWVDAVCLGEGESVFSQLIAAIENGQSLSGLWNVAYRGALAERMAVRRRRE